MFDERKLVAGALLRIPGYASPARVVSVNPGAYWDFVLEEQSGHIYRVSLAETELPDIEVVDAVGECRFDAAARVFRLGVEARVIRARARHDMGALAVSSIEPLPHQLETVYGRFLDQPRLRFLLADDPGAGKTIMAGLYIKELQLRGAADRVLIVAPANLGFQWQRELDERFGITARRITRDTLDADPMSNPWESDGVFVISRDLLKIGSVMEGFDSGLRRWDLAILDEAHGYSLKVDRRGGIDNRTGRYKAAERVASQADRLILLTATPHSGREESLWGLMRLLDADAYGDRCPEQVAVMEHHYSRTTKERMVDLRGQPLFRPRFAHTVTYQLAGPEWDLYQQVSDFITQGLVNIRGGDPNGAKASVSGFALTVMQRRLASSIRAITETLRRRVARLEDELGNPSPVGGVDGTQADDHDANGDRPEDERWDAEERALNQITSARTVEEIRAELDLVRPLLTQAEATELLGTEVKLTELWKILDTYGVGDDASKKLLIFTEHKDTLDFLVEQLRGHFTVTAIHGRMKPRERVQAERDFREHAQVMVATEAAGEGINLQFCHLMVNYDIPWNPNRLEQRMGRVHRIGQTEDVHIFNLVAANTKEGQVLSRVLSKIEVMRNNPALGDQIFDVIGDILAGYKFRELLESVISAERTPTEVLGELGTEDDRFRDRLLERMRELSAKALATGHVDWQLQRRAATRADERRLPPEHLKRFFLDAIDYLGGKAESRLDQATLRVTRTPDVLIARDRDRGTLRQLQPSYERVTFEKTVITRPAAQDAERGAPRAELCGPGHPLFEALLDYIVDRTEEALRRGAVLRATDVTTPAVLSVLSGELLDGHHTVVHRSIAFVIEQNHQFRTAAGALYDCLPAVITDLEGVATLSPEPESAVAEWARANIYEDRLTAVREQRTRTADIQQEFLETSFRALIARYDTELIDLEAEVEQRGHGAQGRYRRAELARRTAQERRDRRLSDTEQTRRVDRGQVTLLARAVLLPMVSEHGADPAGMRADPAIDRIAAQVSMDYEYASGSSDLRSASQDEVGIALISEHDDGPRYLTIKGHPGFGSVELTWSEYIAAQKFGRRYWLYVVFDCATKNPRLARVQNPTVTLGSGITQSSAAAYRVGPEPVIANAVDGNSE